MKISVVIPTLNRATLARAVRSSTGADEVIVVGDDVDPMAGQVRVRARSHVSPREARVAELRNIGMRKVTGDWITFMDDDDEYVSGAIGKLRDVLTGATPALYLFRMRDPWRGILWQYPALDLNNFGTPCIVCPSHGWKPWPTKDYQAEDYGFAYSNRDSWSGGVVFREEIIANVRPS